MTGHRRILALVLLGGVYVMDGFDLNAMPLAGPRLAGPLGLDPTNFGWVYSAALFGLGAGGALLAPLGDSVGRRTLIVAGCLATAVATLATALATSVEGFILWRFVTGLALGACLPNCTALSAELAPPRLKATVMALVSAGIVLGALAAGTSAPAIDRLMGWQGLLYVPAAFAALMGLVLWYVIPASFMPPRAPAKASRIPQLNLLKRPWLLPFAIYAVALTFNAANLYLVTSWTPTILPQAGFTADQASYVTGLMQGIGLPFGLAMSLLIDRWKPSVTLVAGFVLMSLCFLGIALTPPDPARWTMLLLGGMGMVTGFAMALPALTSHLFPPHVLSSAVGMGVLLSRVGAVSGPLIGQAMLQAGAAPGAILGMAVFPAAIAALTCLALPRALAAKKSVEAAE